MQMDKFSSAAANVFNVDPLGYYFTYTVHVGIHCAHHSYLSMGILIRPLPVFNRKIHAYKTVVEITTVRAGHEGVGLAGIT